MKLILLTLMTIAHFTSQSFASVDVVVYTIQALSGLGTETTRFEKVYCHNEYGSSGQPVCFEYICAPHYPPTNDTLNKPFDHNILSAYNIQISNTLVDNNISIIIDARNVLPKAEALYNYTPEELIVYSLECIRLTAKLNNITKYSLQIQADPKLQNKANEIRSNYLKHDKTKTFIDPLTQIEH